MTGPEHYMQAEQLLAGRDFTIEGETFHNAPSYRDVAAAQVHATLALAAATAMQAGVDGMEAGMGSDEGYAWYVAAGVRPVRSEDEPTNEDMFTGDELREMDEADEYGHDAQTHAESIAASQADEAGDDR